jgi:5'-3' exonuclease
MNINIKKEIPSMNVKISSIDMENDYSIEDINPNNEKGKTKYLVNIKQEKFSKVLHGIIKYIVGLKKSNKKITISLEINDTSIDNVIAIYLTDLHYGNDIDLNVFIPSEDDLDSFNGIGEALMAIQKVKANVCNNNKEQLKIFLTESYDLMNVFAKKIIDNAYAVKVDNSPKETNSPEVELKKEKTLFIIDTHNFYHRNYHGMPYMANKDGEATAVIKALITHLKYLNVDKSDYIVFASEGTSEKDFRKDLYPEYKGNRSKTPDELKSQIKICDTLLEKMGFKVLRKDGYEADDVIASITKNAKDLSIKIFSTDKDLYQLIEDKVSIFDTVKKIPINEKECIEKFGVTPSQMIDYQALVGDTSDNIPGCKGIGKKTACKLLSDFGSLDGLYENTNKLKGKQKENLETSKDVVYMSKELVTLKTNLFDTIDIEQYKYPETTFSKISDELAHYEIKV